MQSVTTQDLPAHGRLTKLSTANVSQLALESIRAAIINQTLPPGSRILESVLAGQLNVSKTPVREALITLREIGLIEPGGRQGDRVVRRSRETLQHAYDIREGLEVFAVRCAAERSLPEQREQIRSEAARSLEGVLTGDLSLFHDCDTTFHRAITNVAANPHLSRIVENTFTLIATLRERDLRDQSVSIRCGEQHVAIAAAIDARDPESAEKLLREHIRYVGERVIADMEKTLQDPDAGGSPADEA